LGPPELLRDTDFHIIAVGVSHDYLAHSSWRSSAPEPSARPPQTNFVFLDTLKNSQIDDLAAQLLDKMTAKPDKYSVILPTYNERQNLPVLVQMLSDTFTKE
jgi:hypothetical protein